MRRSRRAGAFPVRKRVSLRRAAGVSAVLLSARAGLRAHAGYPRLCAAAAASGLRFGDSVRSADLWQPFQRDGAERRLFAASGAACAVRGAGAFRPSAALRALHSGADAAGHGHAGELWLAGRGALPRLRLRGRRQKASGAVYRAPDAAVFRFAAVFRRGARLGDDFPLRGAVGRSDSAL